MTDLLDLLDQIASNIDPGPGAVKVDPETNRVAGHIVIWTEVPHHKRKPESDGCEYVAFLDMGSVLSLWSGQGADFRPAEVRQLAEALNAWADRAEGRTTGVTP